jgi:hypothetical protein
LILSGSYTQAVFYAALSTAAGLAAAYCGELAGRKTTKLVRSKVKTAEESGAE